MHRDVKIGIAIGVLLVALVGIYWWAREGVQTPVVPPEEVEPEAALLPPVEPVAPVGEDLEPSLPEIPEVAGLPVESVAPEEIPAAGTVPEPQRPEVRTHVVAKGDTLIRIARRYYGNDANWRAILEANRDTIADPDNIPVGMEILVPDLSASTRLPRTSITLPGPDVRQRTHTVGPGETLSSIAKRYYGSEDKWRLIYEENRQRIGADPNRLTRGTVLTIPSER